MLTKNIAVVGAGGIASKVIMPAVRASAGLTLCGFSSRDPDKTRADALRMNAPEVTEPG